MKYTFKASAEKKTMLIYDEIGTYYDEISAKQIERELQGLDNVPLEIHINSGGGDVFEGFTIFNLLNSYKGHKTVVIDGLCASIASVIAMAGDEIKMNTASMMMIHNASGACYGTSKEMTELAEVLSKINEIIKDVYLKRVNADRDVLTQLMDDEKFLTAQECLDMNFCDEIIDAKQEDVTASYENLNKEITDRLKTLQTLKAYVEPPKQEPKEAPKNKTLKLFKSMIKEEK